MNLRATSAPRLRGGVRRRANLVPQTAAAATAAIVIAGLIAVVSAEPGHAAEPSPSAQQIIDRLAPPAPRPPVPAPGTAATSDADDTGRGVSVAGRLRNLQPIERQIDLSIPFESGATLLRPEGQATLQELVVAMQSERLRNTRFRLEGHTDAKGGADYNERLSEQRARTVAGFLIRQGVEPQRLQAVGKGFREPLAGEDPLSPANRRVRIVAVD